MERAATAAQRGGIALTRLRYREAAEHFAAAARRLPPGEEEQALACLDQEAEALYRQGEEFGDNAALVDAIARYRALLDRRPRERVPLDWAMTQNNLGNALRTLGERESGTARLDEAITAYREALKEWTRERVPLDWAMTQNNLGNALLRLGERESGTARLDEAVAAYREALKERTRERVPLDWAMTQNNLGLALSTLGRAGERHGAPGRGGRGLPRGAQGADPRARPARLGHDPEQPGQRASTLGRAGERHGAPGRGGRGLPRGPRGDDPRARPARSGPTTQNNLGNALADAWASGRAARRAWTRRSRPTARPSRSTPASASRSHWAATQNNLGTALCDAGERESGTARLDEAVAAYRAALKERDPRARPARLGDDPEQPGHCA